ncbi:hypothetical protein [Streptomyces sp. NPDC060027]|uniref:hypothetical protein n=1 Tax=Streptomyces sp. NPDC060027 TaxID=3347040 RepID=UPI0036A6A1A4
MDDMDQVALAVAVVGGHALGGTKNGRMALSDDLAGRRFGFEPPACGRRDAPAGGR